MATRQRDQGLLAAARRLDNRFYGPAPSNNVLINTLMLMVRRWTSGLCLAVAGLSLLAVPILALASHPGLAIDSGLRAAYFAVLALVTHLAWKRWGNTEQT